MSFTKSPLTFAAGAAIGSKRLVQLSSGEVIHNTATATHDPIGVSDYAVADEEIVAVRTLSVDGTLEITASGAVTANADVYAAADGKVQALPAAAATYRKIGIAIGAATADGDIIEILPYDYNATTVVSS